MHGQQSSEISHLMNAMRDGPACGPASEERANAADWSETVAAFAKTSFFGKMPGSINPELLPDYSHAVSETLGCQKPVVEPPALCRLLLNSANWIAQHHDTHKWGYSTDRSTFQALRGGIVWHLLIAGVSHSPAS